MAPVACEDIGATREGVDTEVGEAAGRGATSFATTAGVATVSEEAKAVSTIIEVEEIADVGARAVGVTSIIEFEEGCTADAIAAAAAAGAGVGTDDLYVTEGAAAGGVGCFTGATIFRVVIGAGAGAGAGAGGAAEAAGVAAAVAFTFVNTNRRGLASSAGAAA